MYPVFIMSFIAYFNLFFLYILESSNNHIRNFAYSIQFPDWYLATRKLSAYLADNKKQ